MFRYIGKTDSITISVWNHKKIHKKQGAGFLGCVRLLSNAISRLKDTGCERTANYTPKLRFLSRAVVVAFGIVIAFVFVILSTDQRLDLCKLNASDSDAVRGQIVGT